MGAGSDLYLKGPTMPLHTLTALALALFAAGPPRADDGPKGDKDLDGEWEAVSAARDGKELVLPPGGPPVLTFRGDALTVQDGDESYQASLTIDAAKTPRTLDMTLVSGPRKGDVVRGLYEIKGDELRLCTAGVGKERPEDLASTKGTGWMLMTLKRAKK
jgi:uncharacterized protein (TIGR03067 family)